MGGRSLNMLLCCLSREERLYARCPAMVGTPFSRLTVPLFNYFIGNLLVWGKFAVNDENAVNYFTKKYAMDPDALRRDPVPQRMLSRMGGRHPHETLENNDQALEFILCST